MVGPWQVQKPWLKQNQPYRAHFPLLGHVGYGGKGAPKGWQKGGPQRKAPPTVDVNARYFGTVIFYHKYRGYGLLGIAY
eukprot:Skav224589  [mRNA]  locus=scaffold2684:93216:98020:- [translate_table: standard]